MFPPTGWRLEFMNASNGIAVGVKNLSLCPQQYCSICFFLFYSRIRPTGHRFISKLNIPLINFV
jgi:hypothetical protein